MTTETQAPDPAPLTIYISRMDAETLRSRGRCTLTAYTERVGNESNEVALTTIPAPEGAQLPEAAAFIVHRAMCEPALEWTEGDGWKNEPLYTADQLRAALAAPAEDIADLRESAAMLNEIGLLLRNQQDRFVGSWVEIVRQMCEALAEPAPRALTRDEVDELFSDGLGFEPKAAIVREIVATFCRVNGIKEPANDR